MDNNTFNFVDTVGHKRCLFGTSSIFESWMVLCGKCADILKIFCLNILLAVKQMWISLMSLILYVCIVLIRTDKQISKYFSRFLSSPVLMLLSTVI